MAEFCNPINLDYKFQHCGKTAFREAADPTLIYFKGTYYIFASMSAGFYYSKNLAEWTWHENRNLDIYRYAPDVKQIGEYLYFCASSHKKPTFWRTKDPLSDEFEKVCDSFPFWDPDLFYEKETGKSYLYFGCGTSPLYGVELDTATMQPVGKEKQIMKGNMEEHGWERRFAEHIEAPENKGVWTKYIEHLMNPKGLPYIEGPFVNKFHGKFYFQYAAPATEMSTYGNGVYVSDKPLEGYQYQKHNPFSYVPTGFITGAGHGSTIEDPYGNLWHMATMRISVNQNFERRVGLFPAGIDEEGNLFCNQNFASYPIVIPEGKFEPCTLQPHYMLLSYKKHAVASSSKEGHGTALALNENIRSWWCAMGERGEWYELDLGKVYPIHSIQLNLAEEQVPVQKRPRKERAKDVTANWRYIDSSGALHTRYILEGSRDGDTWETLCDRSKAETDRTHDYIVLPEEGYYRYIKVTSEETAYHQQFAISGLRVFGLDREGTKPSQVEVTEAQRLDELEAHVSWNPVSGAMGYNVRYGIAPDKLYNSYLLYDQKELYLTTLNKGTEYWCCVDSFNESGITEGSIIKIQP